MVQANLEVKVPYLMAILFEGNFDDAPKSHIFVNQIVKKARAMESVGDRMAFIDVENMAELIQSRKYALLFLEILIEFLEKEFYDKEGNNYLVHIDETPYQYYCANSVPKTSPFVQLFNEILVHTFESGISNYQFSLAKGETDFIYVRCMKDGKVPTDTAKKLSLSQIKSVFTLVIYGFLRALFNSSWNSLQKYFFRFYVKASPTQKASQKAVERFKNQNFTEFPAPISG